MLNSFDPIQALKFGVIGLGFLLAVLAYLLLRKSQERAGHIWRNDISIYVFMVFSLALVGVGFFAQVRPVEPGPVWPDIRPQVGEIATTLETTALETAKQCTQHDFGATTNTSDLRGCLAAAGMARTAGEAAVAQIRNGVDQLRQLSSP